MLWQKFDYVTLTAASEILGISKSTLYSRIQRGVVPAKSVCNSGGYRYFAIPVFWVRQQLEEMHV